MGHRDNGTNIGRMGHSENLQPLPLTACRGMIRSDCTSQIDDKLALLVYKCRQGVAPPYLADELCQPADTEARCRLRSILASSLIVRHTQLSTIGD